jgi:hypothetical protein
MEVINHMYRDEILSKDLHSIDEYMKAWMGFQDKFLSENESFKRYEVWCKFSQEKIIDGCSKMERKIGMKKELKEKQLEMEVEKFKSMLELKETDNGDKDHLEEQINKLQKEKTTLSK